MLQKENRLTKRKAFGYIYKNGKSKSGNNLIVIYTPTKLNACKVGFSVSKKLGKAFVRNRVKRLLREAFKELLPVVNNKYNYVVVAKPTITDKSFKEIKEELFYILNKCGMISNE